MVWPLYLFLKFIFCLWPFRSSKIHSNIEIIFLPISVRNIFMKKKECNSEYIKHVWINVCAYTTQRTKGTRCHKYGPQNQLKCFIICFIHLLEALHSKVFSCLLVSAANHLTLLMCTFSNGISMIRVGFVDEVLKTQ